MVFSDELFFDCYWRKLFGEECDSWDVSFFVTWAHFLNQVAFKKKKGKLSNLGGKKFGITCSIKTSIGKTSREMARV
jgi:hypothetical protein